jgi:putative methanogenesis marker protein 17
MAPLDYFEVESPEPQGAEYYKRIASTVLQDHDLVRVVDKLNIYVDPGIPLFIAVGIIRRLPGVVKLRDFANVQFQERKITISIGNEAYLAPLLKILWEKFGKDRVEQPDRFTIILYLDEKEAEALEDLPVVDPAESLYRDLIYAIQSIAPEGFKVRRQYHGEGKFWYVASEDTLPEDIMNLVKEKFARMGESL